MIVKTGFKRSQLPFSSYIGYLYGHIKSYTLYHHLPRDNFFSFEGGGQIKFNHGALVMHADFHFFCTG